MRLDGSEQARLNDQMSTDIHVFYDWVYYYKLIVERRLIRMRPDGSDSEVFF